MEKNKATITKDIEGNTDTLKEPEKSAAEEASGDLFNPTSMIFVNSVVCCCILLVAFSLAGIAFQVFYLDPRTRMIEAAKKLEMVESVEVKEMAARSKMMKDVLLQEVRSFYASWGDRLSLMTKRHKAEQKKLVARGPAPAPNRPAPLPIAQTPKRHSPSPQLEEAIEIENTSVVEEEEQQEASRSSSTTFSNKSTASLIRDDDDGEDGPAPDNEGKEDQPPPAVSQVSVRSRPPTASPLDNDAEAAKSNVSLRDMGASSGGESPGPQPLGSQISVKPLIEDDGDEESKV